MSRLVTGVPLLILVAVLHLQAAPAAPVVTARAAAAITTYLEGAVAHRDIAGAVALVVNRDGIVYHEAFGMLSEQKGLPTTPGRPLQHRVDDQAGHLRRGLRRCAASRRGSIQGWRRGSAATATSSYSRFHGSGTPPNSTSFHLQELTTSTPSAVRRLTMTVVM